MGRQKKLLRQVQSLFVELFTIKDDDTYHEITSDLVEKIEQGMDINIDCFAVLIYLIFHL